MKAWIFLILAGLCEIGWLFSMKYSMGFSRLWPTVITIIVGTVSFILLAHALKTIPAGTAYAIWTGIGAAGTAIIGIIILNEPRDALRIFSILLIISGIIGLKISSAQS
jgi:quaternary ammonium compound-resistance protein SugE